MKKNFSLTLVSAQYRHVCDQLLSHVWLVAGPMDYGLPDSSVHGIFQARMLERVAISSLRGSSRPRDWTHASCASRIAGGFFTCWAIGCSPGQSFQPRWPRERWQNTPSSRSTARGVSEGTQSSHRERTGFRTTEHVPVRCKWSKWYSQYVLWPQ